MFFVHLCCAQYLSLQQRLVARWVQVQVPSFQKPGWTFSDRPLSKLGWHPCKAVFHLVCVGAGSTISRVMDCPALVDLRNFWSTGGFSRGLTGRGVCLVLGFGALVVLIYLASKRARNSITTSVAVVMALAAMSGSTKEMFLIGTAKRIFFCFFFFSPSFPLF